MMTLDFIAEKWGEFYVAGGFVMPPLVLATLVLWYGLGWRLVTLQRGTRRTVYQILEQGLGHEPRGVVDGALIRGLELRKAIGRSGLRPVLDEEFHAYSEEMSKFATIVRSIVIVAPLAGLLGTVGGMIETFDSLADMSMHTQSGGIAGGISQALITTQMGLAVAIPGVIAGRILDRKQMLLEEELDRIKDILCTGHVGAEVSG